MMKKTLLNIRVLRLIAVVQCVVLIGAFGLVNAFGGIGYEEIWHRDNVRIYSNGGKISKISGIDDLFGMKTKELKPGDVENISMLLENKSSETYEFYLHARALTGDKAKERELDNLGKNVKESLLDLIKIAVSYDGSDLYNGVLRGNGTSMYSNSGVLLGIIGPNQEKEIKVTLTIPGEEVGNEYQNALCTVDWWFSAKQAPDGCHCDTCDKCGGCIEDECCKAEDCECIPCKCCHCDTCDKCGGCIEDECCKAEDCECTPCKCCHCDTCDKCGGCIEDECCEAEDCECIPCTCDDDGNDNRENDNRGNGNGGNGGVRWRPSYTGGGSIPPGGIVVGPEVGEYIPFDDTETPLGPMEEDETLSFGSGDTPLGDMGDPDLVMVVDASGKMPQTGGMRTFVIPAIVTLSLLLALLALTYEEDKRVVKE